MMRISELQASTHFGSTLIDRHNYRSIAMFSRGYVTKCVTAQPRSQTGGGSSNQLLCSGGSPGECRLRYSPFNEADWFNRPATGRLTLCRAFGVVWAQAGTRVALVVLHDARATFH